MKTQVSMTKKRKHSCGRSKNPCYDCRLKRLKKLCDQEIFRYVRLRDKYCVTCGSGENLQPGHLYSRSSNSTKWDEYNVFLQCRNCNFFHEQNPHPLTQHAIKMNGIGMYEDLGRKWFGVWRPTLKEMQDVYDGIQELIKNLE